MNGKMANIRRECSLPNCTKSGAQPALHFGGQLAIFMKFHSMTSSCLFNRGTTFSQTVIDKNENFSVLIKVQTERSRK